MIPLGISDVDDSPHDERIFFPPRFSFGHLSNHIDSWMSAFDIHSTRKDTWKNLNFLEIHEVKRMRKIPCEWTWNFFNLEEAMKMLRYINQNIDESKMLKLCWISILNCKNEDWNGNFLAEIRNCQNLSCSETFGCWTMSERIPLRAIREWIWCWGGQWRFISVWPIESAYVLICISKPNTWGARDYKRGDKWTKEKFLF